jgi:hypothetical protein
VFQVEGSKRLKGNKKATKINVSSPFSLCSLNGSDGLGTLTGYVFFGKHPDQHFLVKAVGQAQKAA